MLIIDNTRDEQDRSFQINLDSPESIAEKKENEAHIKNVEKENEGEFFKTICNTPKIIHLYI